MLRTFDVYDRYCCIVVGKEICLSLMQEQDAEFFQKLYISSIILQKPRTKNALGQHFREGFLICLAATID